jgi:hypothetical protein
MFAGAQTLERAALTMNALLIGVTVHQVHASSWEARMITTPTATREPACFGVGCPLRSRCARYAAVSLSEADPDTLVTCLEGESFPLFVEIETEVHHAHLHPIAQ